MKTFRTIFATLALILLIVFVTCALCLFLEPDFLHRTIFSLFYRAKIVSLILCISFGLIVLILSLALKKERHANNSKIYDDSFADDGDDPDESEFQINVPGHTKKKTKHSSTDYDVSQHLKQESEDEHFSFDECISIGASYPSKNDEPIFVSAAYCIYCGAKLSKNSHFCASCGKKL